MLTFKYRIYPTKKQALHLNRQMQLAKELYNLLLEKSKEHYKETGRTFSQFDMNRHILQLKKERPKLKELHSQVAQNISKRISDAYKAFFGRIKEKKNGRKINAGFPRPKKFVRSLTFPQSGYKFRNERRLYISGIGNVPIVLHRLLKGKVKNCTIKLYPSGKWYAGFSEEILKTEFESNHKGEVGIDVGLANFATLSDEEKVESPKFLRELEERLKFIHRRVSRKKKGSSRRRKARFRLAKKYEKVENQRSDFLHKLSKKHVDSYSRIAVEELNVKNMVRNHQLAKSIMDASWSAYRKMLHYKAWSAGCEVIDVAPADTTKICSKCGNRKDMPMSERTYRCSFCGHTEDRDINAAKNILTRAMDGLSKSHARGDMSSVSLETRTQGISLKRELYGVET